MFSILTPIIVTLIGFLYVVTVGRFVPKWKDEGLVILLVVGTWFVYGFTSFISTSFTTVFGTKFGNFIFIIAAILLVALYIKQKKKGGK